MKTYKTILCNINHTLNKFQTNILNKNGNFENIFENFENTF